MPLALSEHVVDNPESPKAVAKEAKETDLFLNNARVDDEKPKEPVKVDLPSANDDAAEPKAEESLPEPEPKKESNIEPPESPKVPEKKAEVESQKHLSDKKKSDTSADSKATTKDDKAEKDEE